MKVYKAEPLKNDDVGAVLVYLSNMTGEGFVIDRRNSTPFTMRLKLPGDPSVYGVFYKLNGRLHVDVLSENNGKLYEYEL